MPVQSNASNSAGNDKSAMLNSKRSTAASKDDDKDKASMGLSASLPQSSLTVSKNESAGQATSLRERLAPSESSKTSSASVPESSSPLSEKSKGQPAGRSSSAPIRRTAVHQDMQEKTWKSILTEKRAPTSADAGEKALSPRRGRLQRSLPSVSEESKEQLEGLSSASNKRVSETQSTSATEKGAIESSQQIISASNVLSDKKGLALSSPRSSSLASEKQSSGQASSFKEKLAQIAANDADVRRSSTAISPQSSSQVPDKSNGPAGRSTSAPIQRRAAVQQDMQEKTWKSILMEKQASTTAEAQVNGKAVESNGRLDKGSSSSWRRFLETQSTSASNAADDAGATRSSQLRTSMSKDVNNASNGDDTGATRSSRQSLSVSKDISNGKSLTVSAAATPLLASKNESAGRTSSVRKRLAPGASNDVNVSQSSTASLPESLSPVSEKSKTQPMTSKIESAAQVSSFREKLGLAPRASADANVSKTSTPRLSESSSPVSPRASADANVSKTSTPRLSESSSPEKSKGQPTGRSSSAPIQRRAAVHQDMQEKTWKSILVEKRVPTSADAGEKQALSPRRGRLQPGLPSVSEGTKEQLEARRSASQRKASTQSSQPCISVSEGVKDNQGSTPSSPRRSSLPAKNESAGQASSFKERLAQSASNKGATRSLQQSSSAVQGVNIAKGLTSSSPDIVSLVSKNQPAAQTSSSTGVSATSAPNNVNASKKDDGQEARGSSAPIQRRAAVHQDMQEKTWKRILLEKRAPTSTEAQANEKADQSKDQPEKSSGSWRRLLEMQSTSTSKNVSNDKSGTQSAQQSTAASDVLTLSSPDSSSLPQTPLLLKSSERSSSAPIQRRAEVNQDMQEKTGKSLLLDKKAPTSVQPQGLEKRAPIAAVENVSLATPWGSTTSLLVSDEGKDQFGRRSKLETPAGIVKGVQSAAGYPAKAGNNDVSTMSSQEGGPMKVEKSQALRQSLHEWIGAMNDVIQSTDASEKPVIAGVSSKPVTLTSQPVSSQVPETSTEEVSPLKQRLLNSLAKAHEAKQQFADSTGKKSKMGQGVDATGKCEPAAEVPAGMSLSAGMSNSKAGEKSETMRSTDATAKVALAGVSNSKVATSSAQQISLLDLRKSTDQPEERTSPRRFSPRKQLPSDSTGEKGEMAQSVDATGKSATSIGSNSKVLTTWSSKNSSLSQAETSTDRLRERINGSISPRRQRTQDASAEKSAPTVASSNKMSTSSIQESSLLVPETNAGKCARPINPLKQRLLDTIAANDQVKNQVGIEKRF